MLRITRTRSRTPWTRPTRPSPSSIPARNSCSRHGTRARVPSAASGICSTNPILADRTRPPVGVRARRRAGRCAGVHILDIALGARGYTGTRREGVPRAHDLGPPDEALRDCGRHGRLQRRIRFAARPMVGVIGTAPAGEGVVRSARGRTAATWTTMTSGRARVHLPVFRERRAPVHRTCTPAWATARFDHCAGGSREVRVRVDLSKGEGIRRPWIELSRFLDHNRRRPASPTRSVAAEEMRTS